MATRWQNAPPDDPIGWYTVGAARFDLSDLDGFDAWINGNEAEVELAEHFALRDH